MVRQCLTSSKACEEYPPHGIACRQERALQPLRNLTSVGGISYLRGDGEGMPLVFLHGVGSRGQSFSALIEALGTTGPVFAWDAPGYGMSTPLAQDWPLARHYAAALDALLQELGIERALLIGHSLGTLMAGSYARHCGRRLSGLVLLSPALGYGVPAGGPMSDAARFRLDEFDRLGPAEFGAQRARNLIHDPDRHLGLVEQTARIMATMRQPGYGQAVRMLASGRLLDDVAQTRLPCLIVCGEEDTITPSAMARRVAEVCDARQAGSGTLDAPARLVLLPDTGHMIYLEATEAVAGQLRRFASELE